MSTMLSVVGWFFWCACVFFEGGWALRVEGGKGGRQGAKSGRRGGALWRAGCVCGGGAALSTLLMAVGRRARMARHRGAGVQGGPWFLQAHVLPLVPQTRSRSHLLLLLLLIPLHLLLRSSPHPSLPAESPPPSMHTHTRLSPSPSPPLGPLQVAAVKALAPEAFTLGEVVVGDGVQFV